MNRKPFLFLSILITFLMASPVLSQNQINYQGESTRITVTQHQPVDIFFSIKEMPEGNPFDISFGALAGNSLEAQKTIHGFYDGTDTYVLRFSAPVAGNYEFTTFSSINALSGLSGTIVVNQNEDKAKHGAVVIESETPQKFSYQDGEPYFALAFELDWLFALDMGNTKGLPKTTEIIDAVKANGFNQIVMNVYAYDVRWPVPEDVPKKYSFKQPNYSVFEGTNENPDFERLNISFFQHFDRVIQHLSDEGIVAHVMIYVWNKQVNWPEMYSPADNRYFDYVVKRYQAYPNILWDVSKEALDYGRCDIPYINERISRIRRMDAYNRLVTVHDYEYCVREPDKIDFISIQNWRSDLYSTSLEAYENHSNKPVMNIEHGGYEEGPFTSFTGNYVNAEVCLERNYHCLFAGVYSSYYWQNTSWDVVIYDIMSKNANYAKPKFSYYKHLNELFTTYNFNSLQPYKPKLTTNSRLGNDNLSTSGYPLTDDNGLYLYFVPGENFMVNTIAPKPKSGTVTASWFNIFTGETKELGVMDHQLFKSYKSPWQGTSAVLIIKDIGL